MVIEARPDITTSVITSVCVTPDDSSKRRRQSPGGRALAILARLEVEVQFVDLYCFLPGDLKPDMLELSSEGTAKSLAAQIARLNVDALLEKWMLGRRTEDKRRDYLAQQRVRALASNLPNVSSPDEERRAEAVAALKKLLILADKLKAPVLEIVTGADFVSTGSQSKDFLFRVNTGSPAARLRCDALLSSLQELNDFTSSLSRPVMIALELEPGLSYFLNGWQAVEEIFNGLDKRLRGRQCYVFLNLDIGHAHLLSQEDPGLFHKLRLEDWRSKIVHAHISHHHHRAHMADLPLKPEHKEVYQPWIDLLVDGWYQKARNPFASHTIALELEAASSDAQIETSLTCLRKWVEDSTSRYMHWSWREYLQRPEPRKGIVVFLDLVRSTQGIQQQDLSPFVRALMAVIKSHDAFFDKFTGDGIMALFFEESGAADARRVLTEKALLCAKRLRVVAEEEYKRVCGRSTFCGCQIGLSAGEFKFGDHGLPDRPEVTATGPCVITAARLANDRAFKRGSESPIYVSGEFRDYGELSISPQWRRKTRYRPAGLDGAIAVWEIP